MKTKADIIKIEEEFKKFLYKKFLPLRNNTKFKSDRQFATILVEGYADDVIEWLQSHYPYLGPPGFEHLSNDAGESGVATDHTIIEPEVSDDIVCGPIIRPFIEAMEKLKEDGLLKQFMEINKSKFNLIREWFNNPQPISEERIEEVWIKHSEYLNTMGENVMWKERFEAALIELGI